MTISTHLSGIDWSGFNRLQKLGHRASRFFHCCLWPDAESRQPLVRKLIQKDVSVHFRQNLGLQGGTTGGMPQSQCFECQPRRQRGSRPAGCGSARPTFPISRADAIGQRTPPSRDTSSTKQPKLLSLARPLTKARPIYTAF